MYLFVFPSSRLSVYLSVFIFIYLSIHGWSIYSRSVVHLWILTSFDTFYRWYLGTSTFCSTTSCTRNIVTFRILSLLIAYHQSTVSNLSVVQNILSLSNVKNYMGSRDLEIFVINLNIKHVKFPQSIVTASLSDRFMSIIYRQLLTINQGIL